LVSILSVPIVRHACMSKQSRCKVKVPLAHNPLPTTQPNPSLHFTNHRLTRLTLTLTLALTQSASVNAVNPRLPSADLDLVHPRTQQEQQQRLPATREPRAQRRGQAARQSIRESARINTKTKTKTMATATATATATAHNPEQKPKIEYALFDMDGLLMYALFSLFLFSISYFYFYFSFYLIYGRGVPFFRPSPQLIDCGTLCTGLHFTILRAAT